MSPVRDKNSESSGRPEVGVSNGVSKIVTRIAPSPTGQMHVGTVRGALFNYLFAKQNDGTFFVRIEDTDTSRNRPEWTQMIWDDFEWCGLTPDKRYIQSEHVMRHRELLEKLVGEGKAYLSREPAKDDPAKEVEVVRLKNSGKAITFTDLVRSDITFDTTELGDFVIARSLNEPLYHFAVVVDDADAKVSHVIRGEDILSSTPRQILIQEALGFPRPAYAHLPLILSTDRKKLSKRHHVVALEAYREEGFLPEAIINYLALLGWNPGTDEEYFSLKQLVERFSLKQVQKSGAIFDRTKLLSVNQHWMRQLSTEDFISNLEVRLPKGKSGLGSPTSKKEVLQKAVPLLKERVHTFGEAREMLLGELSGLFEEPSLEREVLLTKEPADRPGTALAGLQTLLEALEALPEGVTAEGAKEALMPIADTFGAAAKPDFAGSPDAPKGAFRGAVLWPLRYALSGQQKSPDPFTLVSLLGKESAASRIRKAIGILEG